MYRSIKTAIFFLIVKFLWYNNIVSLIWTFGFDVVSSALLLPDQMADKHVIQVTPNISQLLTTKERVSCSEAGCNKTFAHDGALRMHLVKSHGLIKV